MKRPGAAARAALQDRTCKRPKRPNSDGAVAVSVKVAELRAAGYADFEAWLEDSKNLYVGRRGRIFIHTDGSKRIFHYAGSKWQNPFAVGASISREEACSKYRSALLDGTLKDLQDTVALGLTLVQCHEASEGKACWTEYSWRMRAPPQNRHVKP